MSLFQAWRERQDGDVGGHGQFVGGVPFGLVHHEYRVRAGRHLRGDLIQMPLHGLGVAAGEDKGGADTAPGADGAKDVSRLGALVFGRHGTGPALGPASRDLVFLTDTGLVLPPQLYVGSRR